MKQIHFKPELVQKMINFIQDRPWRESNSLMSEILMAIKQSDINNETPIVDADNKQRKL